MHGIDNIMQLSICNLILCIQVANVIIIVVYFVGDSHEDVEVQVHQCELLGSLYFPSFTTHIDEEVKVY